MSIVNINRQFGDACEALGLKNVRKLTLRFEVDQPAIVEAEMFLFDDESAEKLITIVKRFTLTEKD